MKTSKFEEVFKSRKPVIGMLHLRGESPMETVRKGVLTAYRKDSWEV